jgi:hypothetical protein
LEFSSCTSRQYLKTRDYTLHQLVKLATQPQIPIADKMAEAQLDDFPSLFSLKGKVAVVTGGSRGLGLSAASA